AYAAQGTTEPTNQRPTVTFRAGVEVVSITAAVRDGRGRIVKNLKRSDFEVIDRGNTREIREFYTGEAPISLAVLLDISGSMAVNRNIDRARHAVNSAMGLLKAGRDEAALFTFDATLREVVPFTREVDRVRNVNLEGRPWGMTSLYDAVGAAAKTVAARTNRHRALLVVTDGIDTGSKLTASEVSGIASSIDVPVYLLTVVSPLDHPGGELSVVAADGASTSTATLADLARWTGGSMRVISMPEHVDAGVADMFEELRYQYLITFEPDPSPGWHPLEIRTRNKNLTVLARGGYMSGPARSED
ncbi:MAG TPA: VWA domain-containing protein, partial [Vicinamibacterales bacterium]|nr:VWA domain-containing protein [Vicinamibacterales bacterium]